MTKKDWVRVGLVYLTSYQIIVGFWQYAFPRSFYFDFPTVDLDPPYSEHLMRDVGGLGLSLAAVMLFALVFMEFRLLCAALAGNFVYALTHFMYHLTALDVLSRGEAIGLATILGLHVLLPGAIYLTARRTRDTMV